MRYFKKFIVLIGPFIKSSAKNNSYVLVIFSKVKQIIKFLCDLWFINVIPLDENGSVP